MKHQLSRIVVGFAFSAGLLVQLQGCNKIQEHIQSTAEEHPLVFCGLGSMVTGGAVWAGCRYLFGGSTASCVIGAVASSVADGLSCWWLLKQKIVQDYDDTRKKIHYEPSQGYVVKILEFSAEPKLARPGDEVKIRVQFALMSPNPTDEIKFERKITLPGDSQPRTEIITYQPGTWGIEDFPFKIDQSSPNGKIEMTFDLRLIDHDKHDSSTLCFNIVNSGEPLASEACAASGNKVKAESAEAQGYFITSASKKGFGLTEAPNTKSHEHATAPGGQKYPILQTFSKGKKSWYMIQLETGETGWIQANKGKRVQP